MRTFCYSLLLLSGLLVTTQAKASDGLEEYFYTSGKIKVVVAVSATVMIGLLVAVFRIDRKLQRIEKTLNEKK